VHIRILVLYYVINSRNAALRELVWKQNYEMSTVNEQ